MEPTISSPLSQSHPPATRKGWLAYVLRTLLWLVATAWLLVGLSWLVLHEWIVPRIGEFRPRLEMEASKALGMQVRIGQITARSDGLIPSFELRDVTLLDAAGREALRLPHLQGALSPASLWSLGFEQLYIDKPELDIRRSRDGKIFVGGLDVSQNRAEGQSAAADWFFAQTEFVIRDGTIRWTDELRQAPPLALTRVDWVMRNARHRHLMRLDATPPAEWGDRFTLRGVFRQSLLSRSAGDIDAWSGQLFGEFLRVDLSRIRQYGNMDVLGFELKQGYGAVRAWADFSKGRLTGATADVALQDVDARMGRQLQPLALESVAGRIAGAERENGFDLSTQGLKFRMKDGLQWPGGNVVLAHTRDASGAPLRTEVKADKLDLAALALIADRLPLGNAAHELVASFAPRGLVETIDARWTGPLDAPTAYAAKGRVTGLGVASLPAGAAAQVVARAPATGAHPEPGRPGVSGASIDFDLTHEGGRAQVRINKGTLDFPGIFEDPEIAIDELTTDATWKTTGRKIEMQLRNLQFSNADAKGEAQVAWRTEDTAATGASAADHRFPGILELDGVLSRGDGGRVHRYLPLVLPDRARHYVRDAVVQGQVSDVRFKVRGALRQLPFANPSEGEFRVSAKVRSGQLAYVPKSIQPAGTATWPALTDLSGELLFHRATLEVNNVSGRVAGLTGLQLVKGSAKIPDLVHNATVDVNVDVKGLLSDALAFVNTSPIGGLTGNVLAAATGTGTADYRFRLSLPIGTIEKSKVEGTVSLGGNDVQFSPGTPALLRARGQVAITEHGFSVSGAQARLLGGDVRFEGGTRPSVQGAAPAMLLKAQGTVSAEGMRQAKDLGVLSRMAAQASGSTPYTATLGFRRGIAEVMVASSLQGLALSLPAPLRKTAESALPLRFENILQPAGTSDAVQDQLSLSIGRLAAATYVRSHSPAGEVRVLRGALGVGLDGGDAAAMPENGVAANINLTQLDLDAWTRLLDPPAAEAASTPAVAAPGASSRAAASAALTYLPNTMAIRARELTVEGYKLNNVVVGGTREGLNWRANIDAAELNGYLEFRQPGGTGAGRVFARLSRLSLGAGTATDVEAILNEQPASIPALDIVVEDLELRGRKLGRIEIDAVNRGALAASREGTREWRLNKFNVTLPEAVLTASGNWVAVNAQGMAATPALRGARRRTVMSFKLDVADSGALLKRFGMGEVIRRGKGKLEGQVSWLGSPLSMDFPTMSGQFNVNMESGQFVKADPGIAKLLGVLSLQSLPRRLALDFRDVFSEGFAFDFVRGDVNINQGVAFTNNLQMRGVNAAVLMEGTADIARETQDIKVVVIPEINAGTASLIATVINPAIGLGSFLAQMFLRRPLIQATTQEFHIDGTWSDPRVVKLERKRPADAKTAETTGETR